MNKKDEWWNVENLKKAQDIILNKQELEDDDNKNDFGSYRIALESEDFNKSDLGSHNDVDPKLRIEFISRLINKKVSDVKKIFDVGCGAGFITNSLCDVYLNSSVLGVDISEHGIKFATKNFNRPKFICDAIDSSNDIYGIFDLVFCFEFYPFSRTDDIYIHNNYMKYFLKHLSDNGVLVINQVLDNRNSIWNNLEKIKSQFQEYEFKVYSTPHKKILKYVKNIYISMILDFFIKFLLGKKATKVILINKK